ncbi:MAG TPA: UDP-N-acetylmuramate dehydrogenase [Gammaproteobacteria bacterium]|nr:UDP-N-acetylmuramate dehydrogenase [Gammaproteobacteria bacterium]
MQIEQNASLSSLNTFGVNARTRFLVTVESADELPTVLARPELAALPRMILGGGSNVLFVEDYPGVIVQLQSKGIEVIAEDDEAVLVRAQAGELWDHFVAKTIALGFSGLENLSLIPGQVGAAPIQNIGAYGVELAQCFHSLECLDLEYGTQFEMDAEACRFGYRDSWFKHQLAGRYLVTSLTVRLSRRSEWVLEYGELASRVAESRNGGINAALVREVVCDIRQEKLPNPEERGNAGSFFKNPIVSLEQALELREIHASLPFYETGGACKIPAAWLIEQCGWKGKRQGRVGIAEEHALVLVNLGGATGRELWSLAQEIIESVRSRFSIELEPEPRIPGINLPLRAPKE